MHALATTCLVSLVLAAGDGRRPERVDFAREIQPLLEASCVRCHGPDKQKGGLRLDRATALSEGGASGPIAIPGASAKSLLVQRLLGDGGEDRMPLEAPALTPAQIALVRRWIDEGATWPTEGPATPSAPPKHWAYVRPKRPTPPAVRDTRWVRNPIDAFVLARLEREALRPSPEAPREVLLRRLSLDLTGLPPSPAEIDAFLADARPGAVERVVDRLLASPHYGERWARPWLDLARYADSNGYEKDRPRVAWTWRDWVIDALNRNMSFKQFTIEQIAGDMLPEATVPQKIATGFHRNAQLNEEDGVDDDEAHWETLIDRAATTATTWLGATLACAQCHNHKFDPFTQKDFYRFLAFFEGARWTVKGTHPFSWVEEPTLLLPTQQQQQALDALEARRTAARSRLVVRDADARARVDAWEARTRAAEASWRTLRPVSATARGGAKLTPQPDGSVRAEGPHAACDRYEVVVTVPEAITARGLRLEALRDPKLPSGGPGRAADGNFFVSKLRFLLLRDGGEHAIDLAAALDDEHVADQRASSLVRGGDAGGWAIDAARAPAPARRQAVFTLAQPTLLAAGARLRVVIEHEMPRTARALGRFRLSVTGADDPTLVARVPTSLAAAFALPAAARRAEDRDAIDALYAEVAPELEEARAELAAVDKERADLGVLTAMVVEERPGWERPSTYLRERGAFTARGERVAAATPRILPPLPDDAPTNRLGLAMWLVDDANPLTARVTVNRIWAEYFGRGIVETTEDFGTQGARPSHPELLDWLATELVSTGWDLKALHRTIVTSATYRQASAVTPTLRAKDPENRLYARGPRFRLDAEAIRDVALAASGLLSRKVGGPSVFPPQPDGLWNSPGGKLKWTTSTGEDRHRRALYTFLRRTSPYPSLTTFDAPTREVCTARRIRTNTPLQVLTTLNDPAFFEAAQALAARVLREAKTEEARVAHAFRLVTGRRPSAREARATLDLVERERRAFASNPDDAARVAGDARGDRAAMAGWTMAANVLLNLDETLTKE